MSEARTFYAPLPQKLLMVLDRLMALGLVEPAPLVEWALTSQPDLDQDQQDPSTDGAQDQQDAPTVGAGEAGGDQAMGEAAAEGRKAGAKAVKAVDSWPSARWELLHYAIERCLLRSVELQQKITTQEELVGVLQAKVRVAWEEAKGGGKREGATSKGPAEGGKGGKEQLLGVLQVMVRVTREGVKVRVMWGEAKVRGTEDEVKATAAQKEARGKEQSGFGPSSEKRGGGADGFKLCARVAQAGAGG